LLVLKVDVTEQDDIKQAVATVEERFKRIDVLVNNAGYGLLGALEECSLEAIRQQFDTNLFGVMAMTKAVLPVMRGQAAGHIINISSSAGLVARGGLGMYNSSKFALEGFSESLAQEVVRFGVKVSIIEPGPFRTDFSGESLQRTPVHFAYHAGVTMETREYITNMHHHQQGDPVKAAQIMIGLTEMEEPPLRLPLGNSAIDRAVEKFEHQLAEFKKYEHIARSADY